MDRHGVRGEGRTIETTESNVMYQSNVRSSRESCGRLTTPTGTPDTTAPPGLGAQLDVQPYISLLNRQLEWHGRRYYCTYTLIRT